MVRYRTESFSGMNYRNAAAVMAFETFCLGNTDIPDYLAEGLLADSPVSEQLRSLSARIEECGPETDEPTADNIAFMENVLKAVAVATGIEVSYALWLADKESLEQLYGKYMQSPLDYDAYEVGPVILSDRGHDGTLYGYPENPMPMEPPKQPINYTGDAWS